MFFTTEDERIFMLDESGRTVAEITFPTSNGIAEINHTFVDGSLRGQGMASKLVKAAADKITADGNRIRATCSYAKAWFEKHSEYDVID